MNKEKILDIELQEDEEISEFTLEELANGKKRIIITENYPKSHNNTRTLGLYSFRAFSLLTVKFKKCMDIKQTNQK